MSENKKSSSSKRNGNLIYLGPTITGVIRHSTVLKNGIFPQKVNICAEKFPAMERLFVPVEQMASAVKELSKEQSVLKTIFVQTDRKFN